ncbi:MAG TPA: VCBS repeat-containing protein, partial [Acidimicrobiales bacterium]|nr:VCBS repeat-containing protein [Acidimicrobiales bacterium]
MKRRTPFALVLVLALGATTAMVPLASPAGASLANGTPRWVAKPGGADLRWSSPAIGDVNGDGSNDVVVGGQNGLVYAYNANGANVPGWPARVEVVPGQLTAVASSPAIGDLDGDGDTEVVVGAGTRDDNHRNEHGGVVILRGDGSIRCRFRTNDKFNVWTGGGPDGFTEPVFNSPSIADVDGDGLKDVVFGSFDHYIRAIDRDCQVLAAFDNQDTVWSSPAVANVDGDPQAEVFIGGDATRGGQPVDGGFFRRLDFVPGAFAQTWRRESTETFQGGASIGVVNGTLAVVTGSGQDKCLAFGRCGDSNKVWAFEVGGGGDVAGWPRSMPNQTFLTTPALGDVDGDSLTDVVMGSKSGT